jgi:hypothetical protein
MSSNQPYFIKMFEHVFKFFESNKEESNLNPLIPWKDLNFPDQPPNGILVGSS